MEKKSTNKPKPAQIKTKEVVMEAKEVQPAVEPAVVAEPVVPDTVFDKNIEKKTFQAVAKEEKVPVFIVPLTKEKGEVRTFHINGVPFSVHTGVLDFVRPAVAELIYEQARKGKFSVASVSEYDASGKTIGKYLGERG